ncbi:ESCRT-III subunit protein [Saccharomycopsis crataegensis]|uniref:ESCRT-III subunit protein n=1 Tax=Saccharomycopsis crataegensis TaxID=43959 RepID=A0AAV5QH87_9ASCO|nr:ESCRT-III subunit protein [Saccharomycopsis crataegensis]
MDFIKKKIWGPDPKEQMRKCNSLLRKNKNQLDRSINGLNPLIKKTESLIKQSVKKNDVKSAKLYAKELINIKKQKSRLVTSKAHLDSIGMQINESFTMLKLQGKISSTTGIMKEVNTLVRLPELTGTMNQLQQELMKSGIINEMIEDTVDGFAEMDDEFEEEAEEEINKVIADVTNVKLGEIGNVPEGGLDTGLQEDAEKHDEMVAEGMDGDDALDEMRERLRALQE